MKMKHVWICMLTFMFGIAALCTNVIVLADDSQEAKIILDSQKLSFEVPPVNEHGTVMVPMRPIFEALQATLSWDEAAQTVIAEKNSNKIKIKIGSSFAYINGRAVVLNAAPYVTNGNTMVPVRFISESLGATVSWSPAEQLVTITTAPGSNSEQTKKPAAAPEHAADTANYRPKSLTVQFVPSQQAEILEAKAKPLENLIGKKLGIPVKISVTTSYNKVIDAMASKKVDIAFLPPSNYVYAHDTRHAADVLLQALRNGVEAGTGQLTKDLVDFYQSMIVVKADSPIKTIEDLKGKKIGWQQETSSAGYVYPGALLKTYGIDPKTDVQPTVRSGHDKAIIALMNDEVDAVGIFQDARVLLLRDYPNVMTDTRILAFTDKIPNDTISVRSDMDPLWKKKIQDAFIELGQDPNTQKIIFDVFSHKGYSSSDDKKFDIVREVAEIMGFK